MISRKDPSRLRSLMEDVLYENSFKSIKCDTNVTSAACLHSITIGEKFGLLRFAYIRTYLVTDLHKTIPLHYSVTLLSH